MLTARLDHNGLIKGSSHRTSSSGTGGNEKGCRAGCVGPLAALFSVTDENDAAQVVRSTRQPLQRLIQEISAIPVVVHHSAKHPQNHEPFSVQELVWGSGDLIAMMGSILGLWFSAKHARQAWLRGHIDYKDTPLSAEGEAAPGGQTQRQ